MSVDFEKINKWLDEALEKETPESLKKFLEEQRKNDNFTQEEKDYFDDEMYEDLYNRKILEKDENIKRIIEKIKGI